MRTLLDTLEARARSAPLALLATDGVRRITVADAHDQLTAVAAGLRGDARVASRLDNGIDGLLLDLAVHAAGAVHAALPPYFSAEQFIHALDDVGADWLALPRGQPAPSPAWSPRPQALLPTLTLWRRAVLRRVELPAGTALVSYTSGSTGRPRGVCLAGATTGAVAAALVEAFAAHAPRRHLCALPLSTLLESVGIGAAILHGAELRLPSLAALGYSGASGLAPARLYEAFACHGPDSAILVPQLLDGLLAELAARGPLPKMPAFVAVGGAHVGRTRLARAAALGLTVHEGYGLTEAGSVVALNRPGATRAGAVGRPLPHVELMVEDDGEISLGDHGYLGYVGEPPRPRGRWRTGDLGRLDGDGFLHLSGRRRHRFVTSYGRNVSPEWIESALTAEPAIAQAVVTGEARPWNLAIVVARAGADDDALAGAVCAANARLPDYARIAAFIRAEAPFTSTDGLATGNGRVRRDAVLARHRAGIEARFAAPPDPRLFPAAEVTA